MATSTGLFIAAGVIVLFRFWLTEPRAKSDGAAVITGLIMFVAVVVAAIGGLYRWAGQ